MKNILIYKVWGYEGRIHYYFGHKKEAKRFVLLHGLDEALITPFISQY